MPKNILQDIVIKREPRQRETVRRAIPTESETPLPKIKETNNKPRQRTRYGLWSVVVVSVLFFIFALSHLFLKATVTVNPKVKYAVLNENLSASKDSNAEGLSFNMVVIPGEESKIIPATGEKDVSKSATGTVLIYNAFNGAPQRLDIDTRLVGSNGKIYKTQTKTTVPGMQAGVPGSVEVKIYASAPGADYNSAPLDFTIFGFKGTPKYSKFYARSKGDITGGFVGKAPAISDADLAAAQNSLKDALQKKLVKKAADQIPTGFILFKDAIFLNINNANNEPNISFVSNADNSMTLTLTGTLDGILFDEQKLTKKIAEDTIDKYDGSEVSIPDIKALNFSLSNKDNIAFNTVQNINFNLSGSAKIVWKVDEAKLIADLLGTSKKEFDHVLLQYPNIDSADLVISPFWRTSLPDKIKDIKVTVNYPK